jgi:hypothetical protein
MPQPRTAAGSSTALDQPGPPFFKNQETAAETAAKELNNLRSTGPAHGVWTSEVQQLFKSWKGASPVGNQVELSDFQCFNKGCSVTATYPDIASMENGTRDFTESEPFKTHNSAWFRSGPIEGASGKTNVIWILFANTD